jgi:uncharacterized protein YjiS (DUF1127 family)
MTSMPPAYLYTIDITGASERWPTFTVWAMIAQILGSWTHRMRSRRALTQLEPRFLSDVGLTADDVRREIAKPFWTE